MEHSLCKLTLVCPPNAAELIVELMLTFDPPISGFTTWDSEGYGFDFTTASVNERVRGCVRRQMIAVVLDRNSAANVLAAIERDAAAIDMSFWIEPVDAFGRMQQQTVPKSPSAET